MAEQTLPLIRMSDESAASGPFIYRNVTGDFDYETLTSSNLDHNIEAVGLMVRDPDASVGEDWVKWMPMFVPVPEAAKVLFVAAPENR